MPSDPVSIAASSLRMSPNMFSVSDHVELGRPRDQLHRGVVDQQVLERDVARPPPMRATTSRQSRDVSRTFALSTLVTFVRARSKPTRAIRSISPSE